MTRRSNCSAEDDVDRTTTIQELLNVYGGRSDADSMNDMIVRDQEKPQSEKDDESFALFNHSFDSFPENIHCLASVQSECYDSPVHNPKGRSMRTERDTELKSLRDCVDQEYCAEDVSPIKFIYTGNLRQQEAIATSRSINNGFSSSPLSSTRCPDETTHCRSGYWNSEGTNPFYVVRAYRDAFEDFTHKLACLRSDHDCLVHVTRISHIRHYKEYGEHFPLELEVAKRRVNAAVCFFGGRLRSVSRRTESIFRVVSKRREEYAEKLHGRYYLSSSRISWEVEDEPPVSCDENRNTYNAKELKGTEMNETHERQKPAAHQTAPSSSSVSSETQKMKYRCKLCNQPKQNHKCPYRYSLHRSIGVMVYPAVNSFTAAEPGTIAPPLTHMNNFVSYDSDHGSPEPAHHPHAALAATHHTSMISPESLHSTGAMYFSPQSSLSAQSEDETPHNSNEQAETGKRTFLAGCKRKFSENDHVGTKPSPGRPFVTALPLRPEHYRAVTPALDRDGNSFRYPQIPLTFVERKRLSDTLFSLSKQIPTMTSECAAVLRDARAKDDWDTAVAELLTQVVVALYCNAGDPRLDGLHKYLLALGISC